MAISKLLYMTVQQTKGASVRIQDGYIGPYLVMQFLNRGFYSIRVCVEIGKKENPLKILQEHTFIKKKLLWERDRTSTFTKP